MQRRVRAAIRRRGHTLPDILPNAATFIAEEDGNLPAERTNFAVGILPTAVTDSGAVEDAPSVSEQLSDYRSHPLKYLAQAASLP
jgi:hypothetical protein